ncbi:MAG TPA: hypothetical protein VKU44_08075, partial [Terriglobia bacterium]|nr:hypothetical protein [Terriglobia bacterium]
SGAPSIVLPPQTAPEISRSSSSPCALVFSCRRFYRLFFAGASMMIMPAILTRQIGKAEAPIPLWLFWALPRAICQPGTATRSVLANDDLLILSNFFGSFLQFLI